MSDDDTSPSEEKPGGLGDPSWVDQIVARAMEKAEAAAARPSSRSTTTEPTTSPPTETTEPDPAPAEPAIRSLAERPEPVDGPPEQPVVTPEPPATAPSVTTAPTEAEIASRRERPSRPVRQAPVVAAPVLEPVAATSAPAPTDTEPVGSTAEAPVGATGTEVLADEPVPASLDAELPPFVEGEADAQDGEATEDLEDDGSSRTRSIIEWGAVIVGALAVAFLIKTFLLQAFFIPSGSMEPTLAVGDRVLVNKLSYDFHDVRRGDLIVFERPQAESGGVPDLIKRVIALPGEEIEFREGTIYIDDRRLVEPYLADDFRTEGFGLTSAGQELCGGTESCQIPEGYVFVMGDNRPDSRDSRFFGPVEESSIVGRAFLRVWPLNNIGFL